MKTLRYLLPAIVLAALFFLVLWRVEFDTAGQAPHLFPNMQERKVGSAPLPPGAVPYGAKQAAEADGAALFRQHCASCHGAEGKADTFVARQPGMPAVGDLTQPLSSPDKQRIILREGQGAMPSFGSRLSSPQQEALLQYLPTLLPRAPSLPPS